MSTTLKKMEQEIKCKKETSVSNLNLKEQLESKAQQEQLNTRLSKSNKEENEPTYGKCPFEFKDGTKMTYEGYKKFIDHIRNISDDFYKVRNWDTLSIHELESLLCVDIIIDGHRIRNTNVNAIQVLAEKLNVILDTGNLWEISNWHRIYDCFTHDYYSKIYSRLIARLNSTFPVETEFFDWAENLKDPLALCDMGVWFRKRNFKVSYAYLKQAMEKNHVEAYYHMALLYQEGDSKEDNNLEKAYDFFKQAAIRGSLNAQLAMAKLLHTKDNVKEAMEYYIMAADQNHRESMLTLAKLYENLNFSEHYDPNVDQNLHEAQKYFTKYYQFSLQCGIWERYAEEKFKKYKAVFDNQSKIADTFKELGLHEMAKFRGLFVEYELPCDGESISLSQKKKNRRPCLIM